MMIPDSLIDKPILIAEDNKDLQQLYHIFFGPLKIPILMASTPSEALSLYNAAPVKPSVALIDFIFQGASSSGNKLMHELRAISPDMIIGMVTGYQGLASKAVALKEGADFFLLKPNFWDNLLFEIARAEHERKNPRQPSRASAMPKDSSNRKFMLVGFSILLAVLLTGLFGIGLLDWHLQAMNRQHQDDANAAAIALVKSLIDQQQRNDEARITDRLAQIQQDNQQLKTTQGLFNLKLEDIRESLASHGLLNHVQRGKKQ